MLVSTTQYDEIERVAAPSRAEFERRFVRTGTPVVLTGLVDHWPSLRTWSVDHFERWAHHEVASLNTRGGVLDIGEDRDPAFSKIRLGEQLRSLRDATPARRYVSTPLSSMPAAFQSELSTPSYCEGAHHLKARFWLGRAGTVTPLHRDLPHNFSVQVFGRKRWLLYPPSQSTYLYPCRPWSRAPNFSRVDPEAPDFRAHPRFAEARPVGCVLSPGEVLFIPSVHWHHVRSLDDNAAVNYWFGGRIIAALGRVGMVVKRARAMYRGEWE